MTTRPPPTAEHYRKRAKEVGQRLKSANKKEGETLRKKQKALNDMADNEDWLAGRSKGTR